MVHAPNKVFCTIELPPIHNIDPYQWCYYTMYLQYKCFSKYILVVITWLLLYYANLVLYYFFSGYWPTSTQPVYKASGIHGPCTIYGFSIFWCQLFVYNYVPHTDDEVDSTLSRSRHSVEDLIVEDPISRWSTWFICIDVDVYEEGLNPHHLILMYMY